jgi:hypothetical protein
MLQQIGLLEAEIKLSFPSFYIDFLLKEQLIQSKLFSELTLLYGITDLKERHLSSEVDKYLPGYLIIGDDSGDYGFFINCKNTSDTNIYVTGLGDMDEASLEILADSFEDWQKKEYDSEVFLQTLYENQIITPLHVVRSKLIQLQKEEASLDKEKNSKPGNLKEFLLRKRALKPAIAEAEAALIALEQKQKAIKKPHASLTYLENKYQFNYPVLYKKLFQDQMLDWGVFGADWYKTEFSIRKQSPPLLFFAKEFEIIPIHNVQDIMDNFKANHSNSVHKFIPFGNSGAGDDYAFYLNGEKDGDIPVVYIWHDDDRCDYLAKNLGDFIFLKMLESVVDTNAENDTVMDGDLTENLNSWLTTHKKYLKPGQVETLKTVYAKKINTFQRVNKNGTTTIYQGLISEDECDLILKQETGFDKLNQSFAYENL